MIGDHFGRMQHGDAVHHIFCLLKQGTDFFFHACQSYFQFLVFSECFQCPRDRTVRGVVASHRVQKNMGHGTHLL